ncbi:unnamed protein product [Allacma fusca]|uniref:Uncharacterized protein n=1 Tax=Allacma fusca TaxID=39272 RepID=A0A8J2KUH1_9HEXA|nr:unnamed protein product [Allacma fusca]
MRILGAIFLNLVLIVWVSDSGRVSQHFDEAEDILLIAALNGTNGIEEMYAEGPEEIGTEVYSEGENTIVPVGADGDDRNIRFLLYAG